MDKPEGTGVSFSFRQAIVESNLVISIKNEWRCDRVKKNAKMFGDYGYHSISTDPGPGGHGLSRL